jgi:putative ABC transport system ATP-binding protein
MKKTMTDTVVQGEDLTKIYRMGKVDVKALDGVSFSIRTGEFLAIMGPSGSGKSTLMNLIGCLDQPTSGRLLLNGADISKLRDRQLARLRGEMIGFVFQTFNLIPRVSALANVTLPMGFLGAIARSQRKHRGMELLEEVGLGHRVHHMPSELSGGERQRVAIARALANNPKILLADEPTGNLDTKTGRSILELFGELNEQGHTIVLVTHDANIASYAERVIQLVDGKIEGIREVAHRGVA